jgi:hypothetical protein
MDQMTRRAMDRQDFVSAGVDRDASQTGRWRGGSQPSGRKEPRPTRVATKL